MGIALAASTFDRGQIHLEPGNQRHDHGEEKNQRRKDALLHKHPL